MRARIMAFFRSLIPAGISTDIGEGPTKGRLSQGDSGGAAAASFTTPTRRRRKLKHGCAFRHSPGAVHFRARNPSVTFRSEIPAKPVGVLPGLDASILSMSGEFGRPGHAQPGALAAGAVMRAGVIKPGSVASGVPG